MTSLRMITCLQITTCLRITAVALCVSAAALMTISSSKTAAAAEALGTWYTGDKESQVRIVNWWRSAMRNVCLALAKPNDQLTGRPKTDKHNADASKQNRPLLGAPIVLAIETDRAWLMERRGL